MALTTGSTSPRRHHAASSVTPGLGGLIRRLAEPVEGPKRQPMSIRPDVAAQVGGSGAELITDSRLSHLQAAIIVWRLAQDVCAESWELPAASISFNY